MENRIKADEVVKAYTETGLKPKVTVFYRPVEGGDCACAIGAVLIAKGNKRNQISIIQEAEKMYGRSYVNAFTVAFDGYEQDEEMLSARSENFQDGFRDGRNARNAVIEAGYMLENAYDDENIV